MTTLIVVIVTVLGAAGLLAGTVLFFDWADRA